MHESQNNPVGYAFVTNQQIDDVFSVEKALQQGTLFPELALPFGVYETGACRNKGGFCLE